jgi:predicted permease
VRRTFRLLVPGAYRDEVDEELRFHLETRIDELVGAGAEPAAARREALRRFGDPARIARECRSIARTREAAERRAGLRHDLAQDLKWALRRLRREPGFALATVAILALGIGASTGLFSVADAVVFRPLPFTEPGRLVWIDERTPEGDRFSVSLPNLLDWRRSAKSFAGIAGFQLRNASLDVGLGASGGGEPEKVLAAPVSADFFSVLGVRPRLGGAFPPEAFTPGGDADRAVLSDALWRRGFGADPAVVGTTVTLDGRPTVIAGVLPPGLGFPEGAELWTPMQDGQWDRDDKEIAVIARLAPGTSMPVASAELGAVAERLGGLYPDADRGWGVELRPLQHALVGPKVERALVVLLTAVGVLLLIACVNVSSLLVARGAARTREMAVRTSLGAPRSRLVRQLLVEAGAIGLLGGLAGLGVAWAAVEAVRLWGPAEVPRLAEAALDARVLAFAAAAAVASSLVAGLLPALRTSRTRPGEDLRAGGRTSSGGAARLRGALVVTQLALAVTLLVGAGLTARSYLRLLGVDLGFDPGDVVAVRIDLPETQFPAERRQALAEEIRARLLALPGVTSAAASVAAPYAGFYTANEVAVPGRQPDAQGGYPIAQWRSVTPGYFETLDVPLLQGRAFSGEDREGGGAVVVSRSFAEQFFPEGDALGRELYFGGPDGSPRVVVGVVGDVRDAALEEAARPTLFLPYQQILWVHQTWLVETGAERAAVASAVRAELRRLVPGVPVPEARPLAANLGEARTNPRFQALLMAAFALAAVALAASGVYGLMAFAVARRRREIGIRMALGARPGTVVAMVARQGAALVAAGVALGLAGSMALARSLASLLYETAPSELATYLAAVGLLAGVALAASWLPARRAAAVDPTVALTAE